jgi:hypothetical protein
MGSYTLQRLSHKLLQRMSASPNKESTPRNIPKSTLHTKVTATMYCENNCGTQGAHSRGGGSGAFGSVFLGTSALWFSCIIRKPSQKQQC